MRAVFVFLLLVAVKVLSRVFYRFDVAWVGEPVPRPWSGLRLAAFLHHTSLFEVVFFGAVPVRVLWRLARRGVVPGADKTLRRPLVGRFFRFFAHRVVSITRRRDHTWDRFMDQIGPDDLVLMAPEGRMMRPTGLDLQGNPMTVRGGIADVLAGLGEGRMLLAYSGGLHHVQVPGEGLPKLFRTVRLRLETVEIADYVRRLGDPEGDPDAFKKAVIADLEARRDRYREPDAPG